MKRNKSCSMIPERKFGYSSVAPVFVWLLMFSLFNGIPAQSQNEAIQLKISYISSDLIYLNGGKDFGLVAGTKLEVIRGEKVIAVLEVTHLSAKSSACKILSQQGELNVGDLIRWDRQTMEPRLESTTVDAVAEEAPSPETRPDKKAADRATSAKRFRGTLGFQWFQFSDDSGRGGDYQQPALRLNFRGQELFGKHFGMTLRTRTRRRDGLRGREADYQNRIYQAALHYQNPQAKFNYSVGRLISNTFSGAGYLDGALVEAKLGLNWLAGVFGGYQPEWQDSDPQTETVKYGGYFNYRRGDYASGFWSSTLGWTSAYQGSEIDREFVFIQNRYAKGAKLSFYQSAEIEINRGWRKERTGKGTELSSMYVYGRYQFTPAFRMGLNYDNRQNYFTYELQNQDAQFFDDLARQGYRVDMLANISKRLKVSGYVGRSERKEATEESNFQNLHAYWRPKHALGLAFGLTLNAFDNPTTEGESWQFRLGRFFGKGRHSLHLSVADYQYLSAFNASERETQWVRLETYTTLGRKWFLSSQWEQNRGDDLQGLRVLILLGYRL